MNTINLCIGLDLDHEGAPYVNATIPHSAVQPYLAMLSAISGPQKFAHETQQQQFRDRGKHHITVVNPLEYPNIDLNMLNRLIGYPVQVQMLGLGHLQEAGNDVFFIVCQCLELTRIRAELNLPPADFHTTLSFKTADIFDQAKNRSALIYPFSTIESLVAPTQKTL